jgi:hypothetical protein
MGICFAEIEPVQQMQLKQLLAALAGRSAVSNGMSAEENSVKDILASADPKSCLDDCRVLSEEPASLPQWVPPDRQTGSPVLNLPAKL